MHEICDDIKLQCILDFLLVINKMVCRTITAHAKGVILTKTPYRSLHEECSILGQPRGYEKDVFCKHNCSITSKPTCDTMAIKIHHTICVSNGWKNFNVTFVVVVVTLEWMCTHWTYYLMKTFFRLFCC